MNIDDYTILHECGRGTFGTVYLAKDVIDRYVALKEVSMLGTAGERELQALKSYQKCCSNKFMLQIYHVARNPERNSFYYTMEPADNMAGDNTKEYIPCTLSEVLKRDKILSVAQTTELVKRLLKVLTVIHGSGLVHRDIKPANIFWVNKQVKLGDLGLIANEDSLTCNAGSKGYMPSPNSCIKPNSSAVDLFALTRLTYRCLSGKEIDRYPELEPTDDIAANGANLLKLILLSDEEISRMTVKHFLKILNQPPKCKSPAPTETGEAAAKPPRVAQSTEETQSLESLRAVTFSSPLLNWLGTLFQAEGLPLNVLPEGKGEIVIVDYERRMAAYRYNHYDYGYFQIRDKNHALLKPGTRIEGELNSLGGTTITLLPDLGKVKVYIKGCSLSRDSALGVIKKRNKKRT